MPTGQSMQQQQQRSSRGGSGGFSRSRQSGQSNPSRSNSYNKSHQTSYSRGGGNVVHGGSPAFNQSSSVVTGSTAPAHAQLDIQGIMTNPSFIHVATRYLIGQPMQLEMIDGQQPPTLEGVLRTIVSPDTLRIYQPDKSDLSIRLTEVKEFTVSDVDCNEVLRTVTVNNHQQQQRASPAPPSSADVASSKTAVEGFVTDEGIATKKQVVLQRHRPALSSQTSTASAGGGATSTSSSSPAPRAAAADSAGGQGGGGGDLQMFEFDEKPIDERLSSLDSSNFKAAKSGGPFFDPNEMFKFNEKLMGPSSFRDHLPEYTTPLVRTNDPNWQRREERAAQLAREIESNRDYHDNICRESRDDMDEEMRYSAVHRPGQPEPASAARIVKPKLDTPPPARTPPIQQPQQPTEAGSATAPSSAATSSFSSAGQQQQPRELTKYCPPNRRPPQPSQQSQPPPPQMAALPPQPTLAAMPPNMMQQPPPPQHALLHHPPPPMPGGMVPMAMPQPVAGNGSGRVGGVEPLMQQQVTPPPAMLAKQQLQQQQQQRPVAGGARTPSRQLSQQSPEPPQQMQQQAPPTAPPATSVTSESSAPTSSASTSSSSNKQGLNVFAQEFVPTVTAPAAAPPPPPPQQPPPPPPPQPQQPPQAPQLAMNLTQLPTHSASQAPAASASMQPAYYTQMPTAPVSIYSFARPMSQPTVTAAAPHQFVSMQQPYPTQPGYMQHAQIPIMNPYGSYPHQAVPSTMQPQHQHQHSQPQQQQQQQQAGQKPGQTGPSQYGQQQPGGPAGNGAGSQQHQQAAANAAAAAAAANPAQARMLPNGAGQILFHPYPHYMLPQAPPQQPQPPQQQQPHSQQQQQQAQQQHLQQRSSQQQQQPQQMHQAAAAAVAAPIMPMQQYQLYPHQLQYIGHYPMAGPQPIPLTPYQAMAPAAPAGPAPAYSIYQQPPHGFYSQPAPN